ncbi:hypothetical protein OSB04_007067 [Centaurea solstitialis]|uniref:Uncharacterized protein n=1 Tax=Centaurea solstitialis TaxID=347529 RepID=A0AA38WI48_9ASTR|nr:hypothetical protein OSB04_007067 [Centaurea solstitialis]
MGPFLLISYIFNKSEDEPKILQLFRYERVRENLIENGVPSKNKWLTMTQQAIHRQTHTWGKMTLRQAMINRSLMLVEMIRVTLDMTRMSLHLLEQKD